MTRPEPPREESSIADTQMFRRFVAEEPPATTNSAARVWLWVGIAVAVVIIAVVIFLLVR